MKSIIAILVVEGIADESFIKSFLDVEIVKTSGYQIPKGEVEYLNVQASKKGVIILTDSDEAGKTIRERLNKLIPNAKNVEVDINKCNKHGKHGVAEATKEELLRVLAPYITDEPLNKGTIEAKDLNALGLTGNDNSKMLREKVVKQFNLGETNMNAKLMVKRLNSLGISINQIEECIKEKK